MFDITKKLSYEDLAAALASGSDLNSMNFADLVLTGVDFSGKRLSGCSFAHACFTDCSFTGLRVRLSFFDFARFVRCTFDKTDIQLSCFAGAVFDNTVLFTARCTKLHLKIAI